MTPPAAVSARVALVTGAGGFGIGTAIAHCLARDGVTVHLNGLREAPLTAVRRDIEDRGGRAEVVPGDVSDPATAATVVAAAARRTGRIDILVSNAARGTPFVPTADLDDAGWHADLATILSGAFYCCRAAVGGMAAGGWGRILFISSSAALRGSLGRAASYAAAKAGLHGLTRQLALELAEFGITVNALAPSQIDTPRARRGGRRTSESLAAYARQHIPLGRVGVPADVAELAAWICSERAGYLTGQVIAVDGGTALAARATRTAPAPADGRPP